MKVLLTGAAGFVGSHVLRHLLVNTDWDVVCPVTFRHKGLPARLASSVCDQPGWQDRVDVVHWDMRSSADPLTLSRLRDCEVFFNVASESHVDRSIAEPGSFIRNNVDVMLTVLEAARAVRPRLLLQMSTDEVYGPAYGKHRHREWEPAIPSNPYSASKAAQEAIAISYWRTYGVPVVITNTMNIIGEMQDPEKFLPMIIRNLRDGRAVTVHTSPEGVPGSRFYLHARNLADAWLWLARGYTGGSLTLPTYEGGWRAPGRFHIVGEFELRNDMLVRDVGHIMGLDDDVIDDLIQPVSFHASRPGHDLRYALDGSRIADLGWRAPVPFDEALERTVKWTLEHPEWLDL
jgi:dTDP-glucose 4,6-dehydratase